MGKAGRKPREYTITTCEACDAPLPPSAIKRGARHCASCSHRLPLVKSFIEACEEFKQIIGYEEILQEREQRRAQQ